MAQKIKRLLLLSLSMFLVSCGAATTENGDGGDVDDNGDVDNNDDGGDEDDNGGTNTDSGDQEDKSGTITFSEAANLLDSLAEVEISGASAETYTTKTVTNETIEKTLTKNLTIGTESSAAIGTFVKKSYSGEEIVETSDEVAEVITRQDDKIKLTDGTVGTYPIYYNVVDFKDDLKEDEAERLYIVEDESQAADLSEGEYLTEEGYDSALTYKLVETLSSVVKSDFIADNYVAQTGVTTFDYELKDDTYQYSGLVEYSYSGDLEDTITETLTLNFALDKERTKLLAFDYSKFSEDVSDSDETDKYTTENVVEGTLTYGERSEVVLPLDVNDYFLSDVTAIDILNSEREVVDPSSLSKKDVYIFAKPKTYTPEKSAGIDEFTLAPTSSSDENVIDYTDDGYFEVLAGGTTTLTFTYYGKDEDGVRDLKTISQEVTVVEKDAPESIYIGYNEDLADGYMLLGETYSLDVYVSPSTADQTVVFSSSDEAIVKVEKDETGSFVLTPLAEGTVTVTFTSAIDSSISASKTYEVVEPITTEEAIALLTGNKFKYQSDYGDDSIELTFNADYSGDANENYEGDLFSETFAWSVEGDKITTSDRSYDYGISDGKISANREKLTFETDASTYEFEIVK
jgi:hypothetical protein